MKLIKTRLIFLTFCIVFIGINDGIRGNFLLTSASDNYQTINIYFIKSSKCNRVFEPMYNL